MKSPVDIKAVLDAVADVEEARNKKIRVHVYVDPEAPEDLVNLIAASFKTTAENATVLIESYPHDGRMPDALADMALLVAGTGEDTGMLVADLRSLNTPSLVVTLDPAQVARVAADSKYPLIDADIVSPASQGALVDETGNPARLTAQDALQMCQEIGSWIVDVFPDSSLAFANAFSFVRRPLSLEAVRSTSVQNAGIGLVVILPGADMPLMTLNQLKMLLQIAAAYNEPLTVARAKEMAAVVGGAFGCRAFARQLVGLFPGVGWAIKAGIGYGGTAAMGYALIEYFEAEGDVASLANRAAEASKQVAPMLGVSPEAPLRDNLQSAAESVKGRILVTLQDGGKKAVPFAKSVIKAAGEATGFTQQDAAKAAKVVAGAVGDVFSGASSKQ